MEDYIGRPLEKNEIVHHIDGNKQNNSIDNLYLCKSTSEHRQIHNQLEELSMQLVQSGVILFENGSYSLEHRVIES